MQYYKYTYTIEVLSTEPLPDMSLADLQYEITEGSCSGFVKVDVESLDKNEFIQECQNQGSDPDFFFMFEEEDV